MQSWNFLFTQLHQMKCFPRKTGGQLRFPSCSHSRKTVPYPNFTGSLKTFIFFIFPSVIRAKYISFLSFPGGYENQIIFRSFRFHVSAREQFVRNQCGDMMTTHPCFFFRLRSSPSSSSSASSIYNRPHKNINLPN